MNNRWAPFNSVINGNDTINELQYSRNKVNKPTLSEDQIERFEQLILESFNEHIQIEITYFKNYHNYKIDGIITNIDPITKKITINSNIPIYFYNLVNILEKNT